MRFIAAFSDDSGLGALLPDQVIACGPTYCDGAYFELSGTSMAAGVVSGSVALLLEQDPTLTPATVKARLMRSARKIPGDSTAVGAGVLDIGAALDDTGRVTGAHVAGET